MVKLTCLSSASQWEHDQASQYPELRIFIDKLKNTVKSKPENGFSDPLLLPGMKENLPCLKHSVNISIFSRQYAIGYDFITATYLYKNHEAIILRMDFS
jgi:hypothetical protein